MFSSLFEQSGLMSLELLVMPKPNQELANQRPSRLGHSIALLDKESCCMCVVHVVHLHMFFFTCSALSFRLPLCFALSEIIQLK